MEPSSRPTAVIVMGVAGSGKSTVGRRLASRLGFDFEDADAYHPAENVAKMAAGMPLDDHDREPWLERLRELVRERLSQGRSLVLACSALKASYREVLAAGGRDLGPVQVVYLRGDPATLRARLERRRGHYMKAVLLDSQLRDLEEPTDAVTVGPGLDVGASLREALTGLAERGVRPLPGSAPTRRRR